MGNLIKCFLEIAINGVNLAVLSYLVSCTVFEIQPSIGPKSLYLANPLAFNTPDGGVPLGQFP